MDELRSSSGSNSLNSSVSSFSVASSISTDSSTKLSCSGALTFTPIKLFADSEERVLPNDSIKLDDSLGSEVNKPIAYSMNHVDDLIDCDIKDDVVDSDNANNDDNWSDSDDVNKKQNSDDSDNVKNVDNRENSDDSVNASSDEDNSSDSDDVENEQNSDDSDNVNNDDNGENSDDSVNVNNDEYNSSNSDDVDNEQNSDDSDNLNNVDNGENSDNSVGVNNDEDMVISEVSWQHDGKDLKFPFISALLKKLPPKKFNITLRKYEEFDNRLGKVAEIVKEVKRELRQYAKSKGSRFLNDDDADSASAFNDNDFSLYHLMRKKDLAIKDVPIATLIDIENQLKESKNTVGEITEEIQELYYVGGDSAQGKERDENEDSEEDIENSEDESEEELNSKTLDKEDTEDEFVKDLNSKIPNKEDSEDSEDESTQELNGKTSDKKDTEDTEEDESEDSGNESN